jgi:hypothetical protein
MMPPEMEGPGQLMQPVDAAEAAADAARLHELQSQLERVQMEQQKEHQAGGGGLVAAPKGSLV